MLHVMLHEDSYVSDTWMDEGLGVYVGTLARAGSFSEKGITFDERGDVMLAFSGEEYSASRNTQQLAKLAEQPSFPAALNGRFHGMLVDALTGVATLFNDRFGMHRLYYYQAAGTFYFASEAKAILSVCPETRELNFQSFGELVSCGATLENRSLFKGIGILPPASKWTFRNGALHQRNTYFNASAWENQEPLAAEPYYSALLDAFQGSVARCFSGSEDIAMSLTGGLDTRMVMACRQPARDALPCYTFGSMYRENQDVRRARELAQHCHQDFQVLTAGRDFLSQFSKYAERSVYLTDGCVDVSRAPDLYLNQQARAIAHVRMTGLFGGEILRGVRAFKPVATMPGLFTSEFEQHTTNAAETYARALACHPTSFAVFKQNPWYLHGSLSLEETQLTTRSPFLDNDFVRTVFRSPAAELASSRMSWRLVKDGNPALLKLPTDRGLTANPGSWKGRALHGIMEFLFKAEYAYDSGMPQWLAGFDHALSRLHLERMFLGRHKPFHFRLWYRDSLGAYIKEILLDERTLSRPYLNRYAVQKVVRGHLKGNRNFTHEIHKLLTLELIERVILERHPERHGPNSRSVCLTAQ